MPGGRETKSVVSLLDRETRGKGNLTRGRDYNTPSASEGKKPVISESLDLCGKKRGKFVE